MHKRRKRLLAEYQKYDFDLFLVQLFYFYYCYIPNKNKIISKKRMDTGITKKVKLKVTCYGSPAIMIVFLLALHIFCVKFWMFYDPRSNTFLNDILIG